MKFKDRRVAEMALSFLSNGVELHGVPVSYGVKLFEEELEPERFLATTLDGRVDKLRRGLEHEIRSFGSLKSMSEAMHKISEDYKLPSSKSVSYDYIQLVLDGIAFIDELKDGPRKIEVKNLPEVVWYPPERTIELACEEEDNYLETLEEYLIGRIEDSFPADEETSFGSSLGFVYIFSHFMIHTWSHLLQTAQWVSDDVIEDNYTGFSSPTECWLGIMETFKTFCDRIDVLPEYEVSVALTEQ